MESALEWISLKWLYLDENIIHIVRWRLLVNCRIKFVLFGFHQHKAHIGRAAGWLGSIILTPYIKIFQSIICLNKCSFWHQKSTENYKSKQQIYFSSINMRGANNCRTEQRLLIKKCGRLVSCSKINCFLKMGQSRTQKAVIVWYSLKSHRPCPEIEVRGSIPYRQVYKNNSLHPTAAVE